MGAKLEAGKMYLFQKRCKFCGDNKGAILEWDESPQFIQCAECHSTRPVGEKLANA